MSSFIVDVLSTVNYDVKIYDPSRYYLGKEMLPVQDLSNIALWDLDAFGTENEPHLKVLKQIKPDIMIFAYAEDITNYNNLSPLLDICMNSAAVRVHLMSQIAKLKRIISARQTFKESMSHLVGKSPAMEQLRNNVLKAMIHSGPVLIQGETGVGKELIARAVACTYDKLITVNCSAIPDNLFESELFGHTRGAFTGAQNERIGLFEAADGGAIFLDEIGDMPLHAQVKLLRVLQDKEIRPIGANKSKHINVRIIAATNRDLKKAVLEKKFREDLYYRLNVIPLSVHPLRERTEDIEDLANYFIQLYKGEGESYTLSKEALQHLQSHSWPGNIRELENVIQRTLCFTNSGILQPEDFQIDREFLGESLPRSNFYEAPNIESAANFEKSRGCTYPDADLYEEFREKQLDQEREFLKAKIHENNNSISQTATNLGMLRTALYNRLTRLGISIKEI
ncbi:MAG: sigma-54 dependent transcriptional regulator [Fibrobacter sp.]|nr:sigma-54 dependent transcriptional regulator [Fibrobacter sp.]